MPPNADSRRGSHLREHLLFLLLLLTLNVFAPPALAQNAPPAPAVKPPGSGYVLQELLQTRAWRMVDQVVRV
ncbi:hypothetical protein LOS08_24040, partial [Proteus mirabilis]|uniref:hypothetical protein n=1 Tax=Proteus mirabilis TaxID=584 RepID=UPI001E3C12A9